MHSSSFHFPRAKLQDPTTIYFNTRTSLSRNANQTSTTFETSNPRMSAVLPHDMKALVFSLLLLSLFAGSPPLSARSFEFPAKAMASLIEQTCRLTPFYDLCLSALRSDPQSGAADVRGLARIMAGSVLASTSRTLDRIQELLGQAPDPETERPLAYCAELYIPVVKYSLPQAIDALDKGQFGFAVYGLSDAEKEAAECEKNLAGQGGSPVTEGNEMVRHLVDVALAIIKILQRGF